MDINWTSRRRLGEPGQYPKSKEMMLKSPHLLVYIFILTKFSILIQPWYSFWMTAWRKQAPPDNIQKYCLSNNAANMQVNINIEVLFQ